MDKIKSRKRRSLKTRAKIKELAVHRLCVYKSHNNIYAQLISPCGGLVLAAASTLDKELKTQIKHGGNQDAAKLVGELIAKRASAAGVKKVAFDRSGNPYHGRIKALADAARSGGIEF